MQIKIEQLFKEYLELKNYISKQEKENPIEKVKKNLAEKALAAETEQEELDIYFREIGEREIIKLDFLELQKNLYYFVKAYSDFISIPEEIEKEVEGVKPKYIFDVKNGVKTIVNKELYNNYKEQYSSYIKALRKEE